MEPQSPRRWQIRHDGEIRVAVEVTGHQWDRLGELSREILLLPEEGIVFVRVEAR